MIKIKGETCLSIDDLVRRWNGSYAKGTLYNWISEGKGPMSFVWGGKRYYKLTDVDEYEIANTLGE